MESTSRNVGKKGTEEENVVLYAIESLQSKEETIVSKRCRRNTETQKTLILSIRRSRSSANCRDLFLQNIHGSYSSIPKHITTFDEKYILRCLELIRNFALRAAAWNFSSKVDISSDPTSNLAEIKSRSSISMAMEYPFGGGTEVVMNSTGDWTIGTVSGSQTMINILKSPLLQQFGSFDGKVNFGKTNLLDVNESFYSDYVGSIREPTSTLSLKLQNDVKVIDHKHAFAPLHKRHASMSSSSSSFSDQSSSSLFGTSFQGMLQCKWKDGLPHHVFTIDDNREAYVASLTKVSSPNDKDLDYFYTFGLRGNGKKECDFHELESESVGKMRVSTSVTFCNNSEVRETQFVLSVSSDNSTGEMQTSNRAHKKNRKLTRKVVNVFRPGHYYRHRSSSILGGSSGNFEDTPLDLPEDVHNNFLDQDESCSDNKYAPNLELAAIVVKDVCNIRREAEIGGWGLKFLKKPGNNANMTPSECSQDASKCSASMDILIPAGFHGGPRSRVGGPSSLIERWISGGHCDCGGWDIGCPLKILNTRSSSKNYSSRADNSGLCKSVDLFMQGSKQNAPIMKMVNIHEGLYYVHFQSPLSTLQSFAIAAAIIHSHSPVLQSKVYRR